jgi:DNA-binding transcriptional MerR regulator
MQARLFFMRISEVARRSGVLATTIRFYESVGVLPPAHRLNGQRIYGPDTLDRIAVIRFGLNVGFSLSELKSLFSGFNSRSTKRKTAQSKIEELQDLQARIQLMKQLLKQISICRCGTIREIAERLIETGALTQLSAFKGVRRTRMRGPREK